MSDEEYEIHVDLSPVGDKTSIWKEFRIEKCKECGRTPGINRDFNYTDDRRYSIKCICGRKAGGPTSTQAIYNWNLL